MKRIMKSVAVYGEISDSSEEWISWLNYANEFLKVVSQNKIYIGIKADGFGNKIRVFDTKTMKKVIESIGKGINVESIGLYALPDDYKQASFDYDAYISRVKSRRNEFVQVTLLKEVFDEKSSIDNEFEKLSKYITGNQSLAFEMDAKEFPPKYIMGKGRGGNYKSLRVLKEI